MVLETLNNERFNFTSLHLEIAIRDSRKLNKHCVIYQPEQLNKVQLCLICLNEANIHRNEHKSRDISISFGWFNKVNLKW